jgi:hypothetical protein
MPVTRASLFSEPGLVAFDAPLCHSWNDDDPLVHIGLADAQTESMLGQASDWGKFVYSLGCTDWVLTRLERFATADWPWLFRDACWAFELDASFMLPSEIEDHPQEGPVDGPICLVLTTVLNTRYGFDEGNAEIDASIAEKIALHVLPDPRPFMRWRDTVLHRLVRAGAAAKSSPGLRLSMSILDIAAPLSVAAPRSLPEDLMRLSLVGNPYARRLADFRD